MLRPFGRDTFETSADGSPILVSPMSKGWVARRWATPTSAEHPGTAVAWHGHVFEVREALLGADGTVRYRLAPWEDRHAIRVVAIYDEESERGRVREQTERHASVRRRGITILLAPLAGHLPADVQRKMEGDFGAPARAMTIASALPLFVMGFLGLIASRVAAMGTAPFLPWLAARPWLDLFLAAESGVRLWISFVLGEPIGSVVGVVSYETWCRARGRPPVVWKGIPASHRLDAVERFRVIEPLLALLSSAEQTRLAKRFGFDPVRWGKRSAVLLAVVGGLNVLASLIALSANAAALADWIWLLLGTGLCLEQLARWRELSWGRPAGSVLAAVARPLARTLLS